MKNGHYSLKERLLAMLLSVLMFMQLTSIDAVAEGVSSVVSDTQKGAQYAAVSFCVEEEDGSRTQVGNSTGRSKGSERSRRIGL